MSYDINGLEDAHDHLSIDEMEDNEFSTNGEILEQIDSKLDEIDELIHNLNITNKRDLLHQVHTLFVDIERKVNEAKE